MVEPKLQESLKQQIEQVQGHFDEAVREAGECRFQSVLSSLAAASQGSTHIWVRAEKEAQSGNIDDSELQSLSDHLLKIAVSADNEIVRLFTTKCACRGKQ